MRILIAEDDAKLLKSLVHIFEPCFGTVGIKELPRCEYCR
jgi:hypothetical protein